jgi:hypothetical protein
MGFYEGQDGPAVVKSAKSGTNGFKKGGMAKGSCMKKGGKAVMSSAAKGKKPARASGGGVFSSAHSGSPRGASPKPY